MKLTDCTIDNIEDKLKENERNGIVLIDLESLYYINRDNQRYKEILHLIKDKYSDKCFFINVNKYIREYINSML